MKTLKSIVAALLIAFSFSAFAEGGVAKEKLEMSYALKTYIAAVTQGKIANLPEVLDTEVKFTSTRGQSIVNHTKVQMLNALKEDENVIQNCTTEYSVVESTPTFSVVKVSMKYEGFSKISYLNLTNTSKGWKITSVTTSFI